MRQKLVKAIRRQARKIKRETPVKVHMAWWVKPVLGLLKAMDSFGISIGAERVKRIGRAGTRVELA